MATKIQITCDACGQPIDRTKGFVNFNPLRGGLFLEVGTPQGTAGRQITGVVQLCGPGCLVTYAEAIAAEIKPATPPAGSAKSPQPKA